MKKANKRGLFVLLTVLLVAAMLTGCKQEPLVIKDSETCIVIKTTEEAMEGNTDMLHIDYMERMREEGLEFTVSDGMIVSINGIDNPADYSSCWMLYTSDAEMSNSTWGTVEYEDEVYGSAVSGAETLKIKPDQLYIWVFQSFS